MLLFLLACDEPVVEPIEFCESEIRYDYAPDPENSYTTIPDDYWTVPAETRTGLRIEMDPATQPVFASFPENYLDWFDHLSTLDGWGISAGVVFRFESALPVAEINQDDVFLVALTIDGPVSYSPQITYTDADKTIILKPRGPLPSGTRVVAGLYTDPAADGCIAPSTYLTELLDPKGRGVEHEWSGRFLEGVEALGVEASRIAAMTVFTTQEAEFQSVQAAEYAVANPKPIVAGAGCVDSGAWRTCEALLETTDFRGEDGLVPYGDVEAHGTYSLPVTAWLPPVSGAQPAMYPVIVCGHGLGGSRQQCDDIVEVATGMGFALVGVDAVEHGDHPERTEAEIDLLEDLAIFAIRLSPPGINGLKLRDNFRQSAWDKIQLIEAIRLGADFDGTDGVDLDPEHIAYAGVSLGGIMGAEPLALSSHLDAGLLIVGGGRVTQIIEDSPTFSILIDVMKPANLDDGSVDRAFPMLQTMMDPGDPMTWAARVQQNRFDGGTAPDIMLMAAFNDQIVPNSTNDLLAQAFKAPGVGTEQWPVDGITFARGNAVGNGPGGATLGYLQLTTVWDEGVEVPAEHDNVHQGLEGERALQLFLRPVLENGQHGEVSDPNEYEADE